MSEKDFYLYIDGHSVKVTEDVYREYKRAEDKERYFMRRLKRGRFVVDEEEQVVAYIPSREVSYEQLKDSDWDFPVPGEDVDDMAVKAFLLEQLEEALQCLPEEDRELIQELFYFGKSEREVCAAIGVAKTTLHRRKARILEKLRRKLENF